jgi:3-hydroxyacyl-CoA dehydrogenase
MRAIDAVEAARSMSFEDGLRAEAEIFNECLHSTQSRGMIHAFFGERTVAKIPDVPRDTPQLEIRSAAVVGAGTMGGGIAMAYADVGIPVTLKEIDAASLERGLDTIRRNYEVSLSKGRLTQQKVDERLALIRPTVDYEDLRDADIVVEAVFENMELKKKVFTEIDAVAKDGALLATNTSTLDVDEIASATNRPERVIGHHFFSPANVMRLLEIVRGAKTDKDVIATSMLLAKRLRKVGVLVGNCWGFVGNRMFGPYMREAQFLVEEGAKVEEVDAALCEFGMAMGPLAVGDLAGIDVGWRIRKELAKEGRIPEGMRPQPSADRLAELGRFGQKTSAGWYRYEEGSRRPIPDPEVETIIEECSRDAGIERRTIESREVVERCVYALINEGARILEDGMALRPVDIDVIYVNGYGFPAYRGGPMLYADTIGLSGVLERIRELEKAHGFWWAPAPLLERLVEEGKTFMEYAAESA